MIVARVCRDPHAVPVDDHRFIDPATDRVVYEYSAASCCGDVSKPEGDAKVDLAIVRISRAAEWEAEHLRDAVEEHVAFIEFEYKGGYSRAPFYQDIDKLRAYSKSYPDCMLYAGFVHEKYYGDGATWVTDDGAAAWAEDRLTELVGYWDESTDLFATSIRRF